MDFKTQADLLRTSAEMNKAWYQKRYPDVVALKMDPVEHYLRLGAALGRDPGPCFDTKFYLYTHGHELPPGSNPLVDYLTRGKALGLACVPPAPAEKPTASRPCPAVARIMDALGSLGLETRALRDLEAVRQKGPARDRAAAAQALGLWHYRKGGTEGAMAALEVIDSTPRDTVPLALRRRLELLGLLAAGVAAPSTVPSRFTEARLAGLLDADLMLAFAGLQTAAKDRLSWINHALQQYDLAPIRLNASRHQPHYDRLDSAATRPAPRGPLVSVLVAAHNAEATLPTTLRSLAGQSWRDLEILVIDDASTDDTAEIAAAAARRDPRIRLLRQPVNAGAYAARNRGLAEARGRYVTLQDADDWSHPVRIACQVAALEAEPERIGCLSDQARMTSDLRFPRLAQNTGIISLNVSSIMFRREPVASDLGGWDPVRVEADSVWIRRIRARYGPRAICKLNAGPMSFQRISANSAISDAITGFDGHYRGARKTYREMSEVWHEHAQSRPEALFWNGAGLRPFPAPGPILQKAASSIEADLAIATDWRRPETEDLAAPLATCAAAGARIALVPLYCYDLEHPAISPPPPAIADLLEANQARMAVWGETVQCRRLVLPQAESLAEDQKYLPRIEAADAGVTDPSASPKALQQAAALFELDLERLSLGSLEAALDLELADQ